MSQDTTAVVTQINVTIPEFLQSTVSNLVAFIPRLIGALVVLLIGWLVGIAAGKVVERLTAGVGLDEMVLETPLGRLMGGTDQAVSATFGQITKWFVIGISILAVADVLAITLLSEWVQAAVSYLPAFIAGLFVIIAGFVVADFIGDAITRTRAAAQTAYTSWFATGTRMFLYFTAIVIGLDTMGIDVSILYVFARALSWGLAAALALGLGISLGWGGHRYVANNIDRWMGKAGSASPKPRGSPQADGGTDSEPRPDGGTEDD